MSSKDFERLFLLPVFQQHLPGDSSHGHVSCLVPPQHRTGHHQHSQDDVHGQEPHPSHHFISATFSVETLNTTGFDAVPDGQLTDSGFQSQSARVLVVATIKPRYLEFATRTRYATTALNPGLPYTMSQVVKATAVATPHTRLSPPHPPLAFRVGVVGHRPNRLGEADLPTLKRVIRDILTAVREGVEQVAAAVTGIYLAGAPILRAISPLAEGTDRLFAEQALDLGFELCCVMPFPQPEFEKDFIGGRELEPDSLPRFRGLLSRAESQTRLTRFEMDGDRSDAAGAYAAGGRVVLNQSDLLVVVWDGMRQGQHGGTEETFDDARRHGTPVVWIDAHAPHRWQIVDAASPQPAILPGQRLAPDRDAEVGDLQQTVRSLLELPHFESSATHAVTGENRAIHRRLAEFYAERRPAWSPAIVWKMFQSVVADSRWPSVTWRVGDFEQSVKGDWPDDSSCPIGQLVGRLRPYFAWPDQLAVLYADLYRTPSPGFPVVCGGCGHDAVAAGSRLER